jgi:hypothetical protein
MGKERLRGAVGELGRYGEPKELAESKPEHPGLEWEMELKPVYGEESRSAETVPVAIRSRTPERSSGMNEFDAGEARRYIENADYPASKEDLGRAAEENCASASFVAMIGHLDRPEYDDSESVIEELQAFPTSG